MGNCWTCCVSARHRFLKGLVKPRAYIYIYIYTHIYIYIYVHIYIYIYINSKLPKSDLGFRVSGINDKAWDLIRRPYT